MQNSFLDTFSHLGWNPIHVEFAGKLDHDFYLVMISTVSVYLSTANLHLAFLVIQILPYWLEKNDLILWG